MFSDSSDNEEMQVPAIAFGDWSPPMRPRADGEYGGELDAQVRWNRIEREAMMTEEERAEHRLRRAAVRQQQPVGDGNAGVLAPHNDVIELEMPEGVENVVIPLPPPPVVEHSTSGEDGYHDARAVLDTSESSGNEAYEDAREELEVVAPERAAKRPSTPTPNDEDEPPHKTPKVDVAPEGAEARREQQVNADGDKKEETTSDVGDAKSNEDRVGVDGVQREADDQLLLMAGDAPIPQSDDQEEEDDSNASNDDVPEVHQRKRRAAGDDDEVSAGGKRARVEPPPEALVEEPLQGEVVAHHQAQQKAVVVVPTQSVAVQAQVEVVLRRRRVFPPPVWERRGTRVVRTVEYGGVDDGDVDADDDDDDVVPGDATATACADGLRRSQQYLQNATAFLTGSVTVGLQGLHRLQDDAGVVTRLRTTLRRLAAKHEKEGVDVDVIRTAVDKVARKLKGSPVGF